MFTHAIDGMDEFQYVCTMYIDDGMGNKLQEQTFYF